MMMDRRIGEQSMTCGTKRRSSCICVPELGEGQDDLELFTEGDVLYAAMLVSIASARHHVRLESYIFADDEIGRRFAEALAERAAAGVVVRLHLDAAGSLFRTSRRLENYLRDHGVRVRWFHRWSWRRPLRYNRRNHRKLLVIDGQEAYVGGFNIHRESSRAVSGEARWRDTHVRLSGGLAVQAAALFDAFWRGHRRWGARQAASAHSVLLPNYSRACRQRLRCIYTDMLRRARRTLYLTTPYFVPDRRTQRGLVVAAGRGVDVRVLVPCKGDIMLARWAARAAYGQFLAGGVRIYEYLPRVLHAKTAVVDGDYVTIGTANLDYRSFFLNYELNLFSRDRRLCRQLEGQFMQDLAEAEEIHAEQWRRRSWGSQLLEAVGWMARRWL